jgi:uncharacterized SAM-binding protein YcdF (DUF218 family)
LGTCARGRRRSESIWDNLMSRCVILIIALFVLSATVYFGHDIILEKAGRYLYVKDELKPADVIVVLGGEPSERVEYGVKLFKEGWARKDRIIMTGGPVAGKYTAAGLMKEQAEELGVPGKDILLADRSMSTEEDARYTEEIVKKRGYKSLILVTSPYQSRRALVCFRRTIHGVKIFSAPVEKSWFHFGRWWKRSRDRDMVLDELAKMARLWVFGMEKSDSVVVHDAAGDRT